MTTAPPPDLSLIFVPTEMVPRDPYHGFGQERHEEREDEKAERRKRMRAMRELARNPQTPNRETWHCVKCFRSFVHGEPFFLHYDPKMMLASMSCQQCADEFPDADYAPIRRRVMVKEAA